MQSTELEGADEDGGSVSQQETSGSGPGSEASPVRTRLDPRTGLQIALQSGSFWRDHHEQRRASGQSIRQYCEAQGLAVSTFRRWSSRFACPAGGPRRRADEAGMAAGNGAFLSVPIRLPDGGGSVGGSTIASIEVQMRSGVKVSLHGVAAERAIAAVMSELVAAR